MADPFEALGLDPVYDIDLASLEERHLELSRAHHPDRHAGRPPGERRQALGRAIEVNEAWRRLKDPVARAEALLERLGLGAHEQNTPPADPMLLMEIMERREALAVARQGRDPSRLDHLSQESRAREAAIKSRLAAGFALAFSQAQGGTAGSAVASELLPTLGELRYERRYQEEVALAQDDLDG